MTDYYVVKPNLARIIAPQTAFLLILEVFAFLGIIINISLFDVTLDFSLIIAVFLFTVLFVVIFPAYMAYKAYDKIAFYFYQDKFMYNSFAVPYDKIINVYEARTKKVSAMFFDSLFNTGAVAVEMIDESVGENRKIMLESVSNSREMANYIIQLVARYKNYKGTSL